MNNFKYLSLLYLAIITLAGCSTDSSFISFPGVYKINIQQGNIMSQEKVDQLKPGMTKEQVAYLMGEPVLKNAFNNDRWDFVYSYQAGGGKREQQTLSLSFKADKLVGVTGDLAPGKKA